MIFYFLLLSSKRKIFYLESQTVPKPVMLIFTLGNRSSLKIGFHAVAFWAVSSHLSSGTARSERVNLNGLMTHAGCVSYNIIKSPQKPQLEYSSRDNSLCQRTIESFLGGLLVRCSQLWIWTMVPRERWNKQTILDDLCRRTEPNAEHVRLASLWEYWTTLVRSNRCHISNYNVCWNGQLDSYPSLGSTNLLKIETILWELIQKSSNSWIPETSLL